MFSLFCNQCSLHLSLHCKRGNNSRDNSGCEERGGELQESSGLFPCQWTSLSSLLCNQIVLFICCFTVKEEITVKITVGENGGEVNSNEP